MNFIKYLSFKYKITRHKPKGSQTDTMVEWLGIILLFTIFTGILYLIVNVLPQTIQDNMNKYVLALFAFLCLISISTSIKKYYKEYFFAPEREILLIAPVKNSQIILSRFFVVAIEVFSIHMIFLFPFLLANYLANNLSFEIFLISIPQIVASSIFFSIVAHVLFAMAYLVSNGKGLKVLAYSIMTLASVGVITVIIYFQNYKSVLLMQNGYVGNVLYVLFKYPQFILNFPNDYKEVSIFTVLVIINVICLFPIAYWLTHICYNKGLLTLSSRDLEKSFYSRKISNLVHKYIRNFYAKKDLLYLLRTPKLYSVYVSPILFTSLIEYRNHFASSGLEFNILINVFSLVITTVTLNILFSDDLNQQDLLFSSPLDIEELFIVRGRLLHMFSFLISGLYLLTVFILESVRIELILYGMIQLFLLTFISSRVFLSKVINRSNKDLKGYRYKGEIVKPLFSYIFLWNIPLLVFFLILNEYLNRIIKNVSMSLQANFIMFLIFFAVLIMIYKSSRANIAQKETIT